MSEQTLASLQASTLSSQRLANLQAPHLMTQNITALKVTMLPKVNHVLLPQLGAAQQPPMDGEPHVTAMEPMAAGSNEVFASQQVAQDESA